MRLSSAPRIKSYSKGFTLIEILVVVIIISISIGMVVVNISGNSEEDIVKEEITRLQQLLRFAHEQAVIRAEEYGVMFYTTGYQFLRYTEDDEEWSEVSDKLLRPRRLREPLEIDLYIEQVPQELLNSIDDDPALEDESENRLATIASDDPSNISQQTQDTARKRNPPKVVLLSSSELETAFELRIRIPGTDIEEFLEGHIQGEYELINASE